MPNCLRPSFRPRPKVLCIPQLFHISDLSLLFLRLRVHSIKSFSRAEKSLLAENFLLNEKVLVVSGCTVRSLPANKISVLPKKRFPQKIVILHLFSCPRISTIVALSQITICFGTKLNYIFCTSCDKCDIYRKGRFPVQPHILLCDQAKTSQHSFHANQANCNTFLFCEYTFDFI